MNTGETAEIMTENEDKVVELNHNSEVNVETGNEQKPKENLDIKTKDQKKEKKHKHKKYKTSINLVALKELEGTTAGSFLDLSKAVILIDGKPYDEDYLALSKERKSDFKRFIEHYAVIDEIGKRKYHIKRVYSQQQREELNKLEMTTKWHEK